VIEPRPRMIRGATPSCSHTPRGCAHSPLGWENVFLTSPHASVTTGADFGRTGDDRRDAYGELKRAIDGGARGREC